ncbi:YrhC family protein [Salibacterium salarium]|nr:YrhC family protein [Salibacterium salarium]
MDQETMVQEKKAKDFHAYSRILMTLACFLLLGTFLPDNIPAAKEPLAFAIIGGLSLFSLTFHFGAERERKKGEQ